MQESEPSLQKSTANFKNGLNVFRLISLRGLLFSERVGLEERRRGRRNHSRDVLYEREKKGFISSTDKQEGREMH